MNGLWFTELHGNHYGITIKINKVLKSMKTKFQKLDVYDTEGFGRLLTLDDLVMVTERDEFVYHEMIVHVPFFCHNLPETVLIIGGGDGGTVREILKHKTVKHIDMVEIDEEVVKSAKEFFPTLSCELDNPKVKLHFKDGVEFVKNINNFYDVVIIDSTDPINVGEGLFTTEFYKNCYSALKEDGILTNQSESPFHNADWVKNIYEKLNKVFPIVKMYTASVPTYPSGLWSFAFCSKSINPVDNFKETRYDEYNLKLKYYNKDIHKASFAIPNFAKELIK
jgi:spermidine synthase